jgi:hypothetical protein
MKSQTEAAIRAASKAAFHGGLRDAGFRRQGDHLHRHSGGLIHAFNFQASRGMAVPSVLLGLSAHPSTYTATHHTITAALALSTDRKTDVDFRGTAFNVRPGTGATVPARLLVDERRDQ